MSWEHKLMHWLNNTPAIVLKWCWNYVEKFISFFIIFNQFIMNFCWTCVEISYCFFTKLWRCFFIIIYIYHPGDELLLSLIVWSTVLKISLKLYLCWSNFINNTTVELFLESESEFWTQRVWVFRLWVYCIILRISI